MIPKCEGCHEGLHSCNSCKHQTCPSRSVKCQKCIRVGCQYEPKNPE